jgi:membrane protein DedA with SNARE-associated domain
MDLNGDWSALFLNLWTVFGFCWNSLTHFDIRQMILDHGRWFYLITFIWTALEGETFVIFAGSFAAQGLIDPVLLLLSAWLGSFSGDQVYFFIGRRFGGQLLRRYPHWRHSVDTALAFLRRYSTGFILTFRFTYGIRNFSSFAMGMSGLAWMRFLKLNFLAAGIWALTFVGAGYLLGQMFGKALAGFADSFGIIMLGIFAAVGVGVWLMHRFQRRRMAAPRAAVFEASPPS